MIIYQVGMHRDVHCGWDVPMKHIKTVVLSARAGGLLSNVTEVMEKRKIISIFHDKVLKE
jgi:hypothetical protein